MKKLLLILLCLPFIGFGQNITIIESQSFMAAHNMDNNWQVVATSLGLNPTVVPQSTLGLLSNLSSTDALIISSGLISLPPAYLQTVRDFVLNGGPVYVQAEYDENDPGSITFDSLMIAVTANFNWDATVSGHLNPMTILGDLSTTPNNITSLNYFWWGVNGYGEGVEPFLEYGGQYFGFCYVDHNSQNGTVITTSDQDWVRDAFSLINNDHIPLMENILTKLMYQSVSSVNDLSNDLNSQLIKVTDLLGRETKQTNKPLLYIYDDGTVEKRIVIE